MALTPSNDDAFFREVDDDLRRDRLTGFFTRWGKLVAIVVVVGLALLAAGLWWRAHRAAQAGVEGEQLAQALADVEQGQAAKSEPILTPLAASSRDGYRAAARLTEAAGAAVRNDPKAAIAGYDAIAADTRLPQPTRDLAAIKGTTLAFDTLTPQQVIERMKPLAIGGSPWFGSAGELTALAWLKLNRRDRAGPLLLAIARDPQVPVSLRGRAGGLATSLGLVVPPLAPSATVIKE